MCVYSNLKRHTADVFILDLIYFNIISLVPNGVTSADVSLLSISIVRFVVLFFVIFYLGMTFVTFLSQ